MKLSLHSPDSPTITTTEESITEVIQGNTLELTCDYVALPMPNMAFFSIDVQTTNMTLDETTNPRVTVIMTASNYTLNYANITESDAGMYFCTLANSLGSSTVFISTVIIVGKFVQFKAHCMCLPCMVLVC